MSSPHTRFFFLHSKKGHVPMSFRFSFSFLILCAAFLSLSACDEQEVSLFAPACPAIEVPEYTADYVRYTGTSPDLKHIINHTQILAVHGDCQASKHDPIHTTRIRISLNLLEQYGPAFPANQTHITIPYFIAVIKNGTIIDKKIFTADIKANPSYITQKTQTRLRFIDIPTGDNPQESPYQLEVGFQLSHDSLSYNRQHLPLASFKDYTPSNLEIKGDDDE